MSCPRRPCACSSAELGRPSRRLRASPTGRSVADSDCRPPLRHARRVLPVAARWRRPARQARSYTQVVDSLALHPLFRTLRRTIDFTASSRFVVGHEPQPLPDVRRADARSRQIGGPDGIACRFQVSANSGEPRPASLARNLLSKRDWRSALADEAVPLGPEMPSVICAPSQSGNAERLAGT